MNRLTQEAIFCANIKKLRISNGLSKTKMAEICGIGTKSLTTIEQGTIPPRLSASILWHISEHFKVPPHLLFEKNAL